MAFPASAVRVMIASPGDVNDARDAVEETIHRWNISHAERSGVVLLPWRWETSSVASLDALGQSIIDAQGVDRSDIVIALIGSRIGAPVDGAVSGTVSEIQRARAQGKPVHLYFFTGDVSSKVDLEQLAATRRFREEVEAEIGLYGSFSDLSQLERQVAHALTADVEARSKVAKTPKAEQHISDRSLQVVEVEWRFTQSTVREGSWDAQHINRRRLVANVSQGLDTHSIVLNRGDTSLPFLGPGSIRYVLDPGFSRSRAGTLVLRPPRAESTTAFAQDIAFVPSLARGEEAEFSYRGSVPGYVFAYLEDLIEGSQQSRLGLRDWDFVGFRPEHSAEGFTYSVFLADSLGATPVGPKAGPPSSVDAELCQELIDDGSYRHDRAEIDGEPGWLMQLRIARPNPQRFYRLAWKPPRRADVKSANLSTLAETAQAD